MSTEVRGEMEYAARPLWSAFHPDPTVHHLHQTVADRQPQSSPAKLARGRAIHLGKRIEDGLLLFQRNADASINHSEVQADVVRVLGLDIHANCDFSAFGKLDGIADQI